MEEQNVNKELYENTRIKKQVNGNGNGNSSSKFKGVVLQQNGHWGAQIYANHQRIWLGTFRSEKEAGEAYDSASIKLRSGDSHRNFPWTDINIEEPKFQSHYTTETVLKMIKEGSYQSKFIEYLRSQSKLLGEEEEEEELQLLNNNTIVNTSKNHNNNKQGTFFCKKLFQKELTPSDVGKLNRLVIPKKFALMYFPHIPEWVEEEEEEEEQKGKESDRKMVDDTELVFLDSRMESWKFRYCYWKSSQSFVFTRGWNRFVKDKGLKAKDMIIFSFCKCKSGMNEKQSFMIDVQYSDQFQHHRRHDHGDGAGGGFRNNTSVSGSVEDAREEVVEEMESNGSTKPGIRLFGVQIT